MRGEAKKEVLVNWLQRAKQKQIRFIHRENEKKQREKKRKGIHRENEKKQREKKRKGIQEWMKQSDIVSRILNSIDGLFKELKEVKEKQEGKKIENVCISKKSFEEWKELIDYFL